LCVDIGGIDEVAAGVDEAIDHLSRLLFVELPPERHGSQTELRDHDTGSTEPAILHIITSLACCDLDRGPYVIPSRECDPIGLRSDGYWSQSSGVLFRGGAARNAKGRRARLRV
jgi:hypothetical protein